VVDDLLEQSLLDNETTRITASDKPVYDQENDTFSENEESDELTTDDNEYDSNGNKISQTVVPTRDTGGAMLNI